MSQQIIYKSPLPKVEIKESSIFTYVFSDKASLDNSPAFIDAASGTRISRIETYDLSLRVAYAVKQRGGKRGDVAMIFWCGLYIHASLIASDVLLSPNSLAWPLTLLGLIGAGLRPTLANSSYTPPELAHQLKDSGAKTIFVHPTLFPVLIKALDLLNIPEHEARRRIVIMSLVDQDRADEKTVNIGSEWMRLSEFFGKGRLRSEEQFVGDQVHETALMCYSSGKNFPSV